MVKSVFVYAMLASFALPIFAPTEITTLEDFYAFCGDTPFDKSVYQPVINQLCQHVTANDVFSYAIEKDITNKVIGLVIKQPTFKPLKYDTNGRMPLHAVVIAANQNIAEWLLDLHPGILEETTQEKKYTPLHLAIIHDDLNMAIMFAEKNVNPNARSNDEERLTPLMCAMRRSGTSRIEFLALLVLQPAIKLGDQRQMNAILETLCSDGGIRSNVHLRAVQVCLKKGAVASNVFSWLINKLNQGEIELSSVLNVIKYYPKLLDSVSPNRGYTPLHETVLSLYHNEAHKEKIIRTILGIKPALLDQEDLLGQPPLIYALNRGHQVTSDARLLLQMGAKADVILPEKFNVLHLLADKNNALSIMSLLPAEVIARLLNQQNQYGFTPLHRAVINNQSELTDFLLRQPNIDLTILNKHGATAYDLANPEMRKLFADFASRKSAPVPPTPVSTPTSISVPTPSNFAKATSDTAEQAASRKQLAITGATSVVTFTIVLKLLLKNNDLSFGDIFRYTSLTPDQKRALLYATTTAMCVSGLVGANTYCLYNNE